MDSYTFKLAEIQDIERLEAVGLKAFSDTPYYNALTYDSIKATDLIKSLINLGSNKAIILYAENDSEEIVGIMAAILSHTLVGLEPIVLEVLWWVDVDNRKSRLALQLMEGLEVWAKKLNVSRIILSNMENEYSEITEKFYKRKGFKKMETTFYKELV